jgi:ABC-type branched-subunit amino acid transport system substrate-binding protein
MSVVEKEAIRAGQDDAGVCAVMAPIAAQANMALSVVTEHWEVPQVGYATMHHQLSNQDLYPSFIRTLPDGQDFAVTLAYAAQRDIWARDYVAIIYEPSYGEQFEDPLEDVEDEVGYETITEGFTIGDDASLREALGDVSPDGDGYRTVILTVDSFAVLDDAARAAAELGIVGEGYLWMITGDALPDIMREGLLLEPGSPLDVLLDGAYTFTNYDPY